jgi:hypothetical protein
MIDHNIYSKIKECSKVRLLFSHLAQPLVQCIALLCNVGPIQLHNLIGLGHDCKIAQSCSSTKDKENEHVLTNSGQIL